MSLRRSWGVFFLLVGLTAVGAAELPANPAKLTLTVVGDINLDDELGNRILKSGPDYPWKNVLPLLKDSDLLLGNLEAPLSLQGTRWLRKTYYLHADPRTVAALTCAGFDYLGLANNHIMDFGAAALQESLTVLEANRIAYSGAGLTEETALRPALLEFGSLRVALLSFNLVYPIEFKASATRPGSAWGNTPQVLESIKKARTIADLVIVSIHWGGDYVVAVADWQKSLAHACIDAGAAVIVGHHPHIVLPVELYRNKPILYSVGNFAFGSMNPRAKGAIFKLDFQPSGGLEQVRIYPLNVNNNEVYFQMQLLKGAAAEEKIAYLQKISVPFGTRIQFTADSGLIKIDRNGT